MFDQNKLAQAQQVQKGLQQFDNLHRPVEEENKNGDKIIVCAVCEVDFPCERMMLFMIIQGVAAFSAMIPTGNMGNILKRFGGS